MTTLEGRQIIMNEMSVHTDRAKGCKTTKLVLIDAGHSLVTINFFKEEFFCRIEV